MYVGYARDIKIVLADALDMSCEDDQVNMNALCSAYDFIQVDDDRVFFENVSPMADTKNVSSSAYFISFPGTLEFGRIDAPCASTRNSSGGFRRARAHRDRDRAEASKTHRRRGGRESRRRVRGVRRKIVR